MLEYLITHFSSVGNSVPGFELGDCFKCLTDLSIIPTVFLLVQQEKDFVAI